MTRDIDSNTIWSKLMTMTKLNHFYENKDQIEKKKELKDQFNTSWQKQGPKE